MISAISKEGAVVRPPLLRGRGFLRVQLFITGENAAFAEALGKQQVLAAQGAELLRGRVADMDLVQVAGPLAVEAYDLSRYAHSGRVGGHLVKHNGPGGNTGVVSDPEGAEHLGARADEHVVPQGGVAFAVVLARTAQGHPLVQRAVVANLRRLTDHHAHTVVNEQPPANGSAGMNFYAGLMPGPLAEPPGDKLMAADVKPMGLAVCAHSLEAGIEEIDLPTVPGRGVALHN